MADDPFDTDAVVVFDLEYTSWAGFMESGWRRRGKFREVIQIGAVKVAPRDDFRELEAFESLVRPTRNPVLSAYITDLTGITQDQVDGGGVALAEAVEAFSTFVDGSDGLFSWGNDPIVLGLDCERNDLEPPPVLAAGRDLEPMIRRAVRLDRRPPSSELPTVLGLPAQARAHHAVDDCRALVSVLRHLRRQGRL